MGKKRTHKTEKGLKGAIINFLQLFFKENFINFLIRYTHYIHILMNNET